MILSFGIDFFIIQYWKNRVLGPIFHVENHIFAFFFTDLARIKKINNDLKPPFDCRYGKVIKSGTRRLYHGAFFYYRSIDGFRMMALARAREV